MEKFSSYYELVEKDPDINISYQELISTIEWRDKRFKIIQRDNYACSHCKKEYIEFLGRIPKEKNAWAIRRPKWHFYEGRNYFEGFEFAVDTFEKPYYINVHHKYYILNHLPWQYEDDALVTLCEDCHSKVHTEEKIPIYKSASRVLADKLDFTSCFRCNGKGYLPEFKKVKGGICFRCNGICYEELIGAFFLSNSEIIYLPKQFEITKIFEPYKEGDDITCFSFLIYKLQNNERVKVPAFSIGSLDFISIGLKFSSNDYKIIKRLSSDNITRYWLAERNTIY